MKTTALLIVALFALPALANPKKLALPVGHSMTMAMPSPVTSVQVSDPNLLEVKRDGRKVTLVGRAQGNTEATVMTARGPHHFTVYVAADKYSLPQ